jgi:hypothetical protein
MPMNVAQGMLRVNEISGKQGASLHGLAVSCGETVGHAAENNTLPACTPGVVSAAPEL